MKRIVTLALIATLAACKESDDSTSSASTIVDLAVGSSYSTRAEGVSGTDGQHLLRELATGDFNGDGRADLVMGAPQASFNGRPAAGAAYVRFGTDPAASGTIDLADMRNVDARFDGAFWGGAGNGIGAAIAVGDLNGDGRDDLVLGDAAADANGASNAGSVYVVFGGPSFGGVVDLASRFDARFDGGVAGDFLGSGIAVSDINGDGRGDLLMSAPKADPSGRTDAGEIVVVSGGSTFPTGVQGVGAAYLRILGAQAGDEISQIVVVDGQIVIGAPKASAGAGEVHAITPAPGVLDLADGGGSKITGAAGDEFGTRLATWDAWLYVGAPGGNRVYGFVTIQDLDLSSEAADWMQTGAAAGDRFGSAVVAADIDADGAVEFVIGAPGASSTVVIDGGITTSFAGDAGAQLGAAAVFDGTRFYAAAPTGDAGLRTDCGQVFGWTPGAASWEIRYNGGANGSGFTTLFALADANGDGIQDIVFASPMEDRNGRVDSGSVYVLMGSATLGASQTVSVVDGASNLVRIDGAAPGDRLGDRLFGMGDIDGDGSDDLVLGADYADPAGRTNAGSVYVMFGRTSWPATIDLASGADLRIDGAAAGDMLGFTTAAGDLDNDGIDDLAICAKSADPMGRSNAGSLYLLYGRATWPAVIDLAGGADAQFDGAGAGHMAGFSPSIADIDRDGRQDLAFAAPGAGYNGAASGSVYVFRGTGTGPSGAIDLASTFDVRLDGENAGDWIGGMVFAFEGLLTISAPSANAYAGRGYVVDGASLETGASVLDASVYRQRITSNEALSSLSGITLWQGRLVVCTVTATKVHLVAQGTGDVDLADEASTLGRYEGTCSSNQLSSVCAARGSTDVTGDGIDDLVLVERLGDGRAWDGGALYVIPGR